MTKAQQDLELKLKLDQSDRAYEIYQLTESTNLLEQEKTTLQEKLQHVDRERADLQQAAENRLKYKNSEMETAIEDI